MPKLEVIVIGASAGGLEAIIEILAGIPPGLPAAVFVVVHTASDGSRHLASILSGRSALPVAFAEHGERIGAGRVYVAPPDVHLLIESTGVVLNHGPRENGFRPAIDALFRSAARVYGPAVAGVVLSGALDDGTYGLQLIKDAGGTTVVQDPEDATVRGMPLSALRNVDVDHVLPAASIAGLLAELGNGRIEEGPAMSSNDPSEPLASDAEAVSDMTREFGPASGLTCPDCGGALWEIKEGTLTRYRCHVGHQFSSEGLDAGQRDDIEEALWTAVRVLEEHADLRSRMAKRAETSGFQLVAQNFIETAEQAHRQAQQVRDLLMKTEAKAAVEDIQQSAPSASKPRRAAAALARAAAPQRTSRTRTRRR